MNDEPVCPDFIGASIDDLNGLKVVLDIEVRTWAAAGFQAPENLMTGSHNVAIGYLVLQTVTDGDPFRVHRECANDCSPDHCPCWDREQERRKQQTE